MRGMGEVVAVVIGVLSAVLPRAAGAEDVVRLSGSTTVAGHFYDETRARIAADAGVRIESVPNSSKAGLLDLLAGRSDIAMVSAPLEDLWEKFTPAERGGRSLAEVKAHPMGELQFLFIVNAANPVKSLTFEQIGKLLDGTITNWKDVGGPDLPVLVVTNVRGTGTRTQIEDKLLAGRSMTDKARMVVNSPQIALIVKQVPGAIGHATPKYVAPGTTALKTDKKINHQLFLVTAASPAPKVARVVAATAKAAKE